MLYCSGNKLHLQLVGCGYNQEGTEVSRLEHPARKITKIAREAEHIVLLVMRRDDIGTAEIDCIHAVRHHPGVTQTELADMLS